MGAAKFEALDGLTLKQTLLVDSYTNPESSTFGNKTASYWAVYKGREEVTDGSARVIACNYFKRPEINEAVNKKLRVFATEITPEYIKSGIEQVVKEAKHERDKLKGYELLGKTHALFVDKKEVDVNMQEILLSEEESEGLAAE